MKGNERKKERAERKRKEGNGRDAFQLSLKKLPSSYKLNLRSDLRRTKRTRKFPRKYT